MFAYRITQHVVISRSEATPVLLLDGAILFTIKVNMLKHSVLS